MRALRLALSALTLATFLSCGLFGLTAACAPDADQRPSHTASRERAPGGAPRTAEGKTLAATMPSRDVRGEPVSDLPRYPGSVRVGYSEHRGGGLAVVRAAYLVGEEPARVRDFYAGVFHSRGWRLANVEYENDEWSFLVARDGREAGIGVSPRDGGSRVEVEFSRPRSGPRSGPGSESANRDQEGAPSAGGSKR